MALLNTSGNAFIYASKYDTVKKRLRQLVCPQDAPTSVQT